MDRLDAGLYINKEIRRHKIAGSLFPSSDKSLHFACIAKSSAIMSLWIKLRN